MIQSMTGYGKAEIQFENKNYILELRSLNSKGLELNARLPIHVREIEVQLKKRRSVTNHIKTVHAIAMCNMAELSGGLMIEASLPRDKQWIPSGMTVEYLKKAETNLTAVSNGSEIDWDQTGTIEVPVVINDLNDQTVFKASINMYVKNKA